MTSVKGEVPIIVQGANTEEISLTITDSISGAVVFQDTATETENTWVWDSAGVMDGTYRINVRGSNSAGIAEDQILIEVQNLIPGMGVSPFQAVSSSPLNAQQSGTVNYNGNLLMPRNDLVLSAGPIPLTIFRYYNSMQNVKSELGYGWHLGIPYLTPKLDGTVLYTNEIGKLFRFVPDARGNYQTPAGIRLQLHKQSDGTYELEHPAAHQSRQFSPNGLLRTITDRNGNKVRYSYNGSKIAKITDSFNRETNFAYDRSGRIVQIADYSGRTVKYAYTGDFITQVTGPDGMVDKYSYDPSGLITDVFDSNGNSGKIEYDEAGRVFALTETTGQTAYYSYAPNQLIRTNLAGKSQMVSYDQYGQVTAYSDENGHKTVFAYDDRGNLVSTTDPEGKITSYRYDARDNLIEKKDPAGNITVYAYDAANNLIEIRDPKGNTVTNSYDIKNNRIKESYITLLPDGKSTGYSLEYTYDDRGNLTKVKDAKGENSYVYDGFGNIIKQVDPLGNETGFSYDNLGRLTMSVDPLNVIKTYKYNAAGRLLEEKTLDNNVVVAGRAFEYNPTGNPAKITDANNNVTSYKYDELGRMVQVIDAKGNSTGYSYNELGQMETVVSPGGGQTQLAYDDAGRLIQVAGPEGNQTNLEYDARGNVVKEIDGLGDPTAYTYDETNNLVTRTVANQRKDFHHKLSNRLIKEQDLIAAEDLAVKNMARNHRLAKSIADAGWSQFLRYLEYKALKYGKRFVKVPPHGTSQTCICGAGVSKTLADRVHYCPECGLTGDRDIVSAKVILKRAQELAAVA